MTERVRSRTGAPTRWAGPVPDDADPMGGRHVLDQDAGLTPIFTTLRRGAWRRPRPQSGRRALRPVSDPVQRFVDDPLTAPIPVVPPLHGTGGYGVVDAYGPSTEAPPSPTETTAWWGLPVVDVRGGEPEFGEHGAYDGGYDEDPYGSGPYAVASHDPGPRGSAGSYGPESYGSGSYNSSTYEPDRYGAAPYDETASYDMDAYDAAPYQPAP